MGYRWVGRAWGHVCYCRVSWACELPGCRVFWKFGVMCICYCGVSGGDGVGGTCLLLWGPRSSGAVRGAPCRAEPHTLSPGAADGAKPGSWPWALSPPGLSRHPSRPVAPHGMTRSSQCVPHVGRAGAHLGEGDEEELVVGVFQVVQGVLGAVLPHPLLVSLANKRCPQHDLGAHRTHPQSPPAGSGPLPAARSKVGPGVQLPAWWGWHQQLPHGPAEAVTPQGGGHLHSRRA